MKKEPILPYSEARELADTFTILNCKHRRWPFSWIGHTAVIYRDHATDTVFVYESTQMGDEGDVHLTLFGDWLVNYPGKVWMRKTHLRGTRPAQWHNSRKKMEEHIAKYRGTSYPDLKKRKGRWFLIKAKWDSWLFKKASTNEDTDAWFFCTHLVGDVFRWARFICGKNYMTYNAAELQPCDMRGTGVRYFDSFLRDYVIVDKEVRIK